MKAFVSLTLAALASFPFPSRAVAQTEPDTSAARLAASTAPPWVPARPVSPERAWESVLRAPGRVVSLPLSLLGRVAEGSVSYVEEHAVVPRVLALVALSERVGLYATPASLGDRTGWGGELRWMPRFLGRAAIAEVSGSTAGYNRERLGLVLGPVRAIYTSEWRSQDQFFGVGLDAVEEGESNFAQRLESARVVVSYPFRGVPRRNLRVLEGYVVPVGREPEDSPARTQISAWAGPRVSFVTRGRHGDQPSFHVAHPELAAGSLDRRVEHLTYGVRASHDARAGAPHWSRGWRLSAEAERYDESVESLALKDASTGARPFTRFTYGAEGGVSFGRDPRTLRLLLRAVDQQLDGDGGAFLIADLVQLGGSAGLAGFEPGRFHDLDLAHAKLSYIFPLGKNLEWDWHAEAGGVYPTLEVATLRSLQMSYGGHLRVRTDLGVIGSAGVDWSREAVRFRFSLGAVE
jgi:hypothetical protein